MSPQEQCCMDSIAILKKEHIRHGSGRGSTEHHHKYTGGIDCCKG